MPKLIAANFKMNGSKEFIESWVKDFLKEKESNNTILVALPSPYLLNFNDNNFKKNQFKFWGRKNDFTSWS